MPFIFKQFKIFQDKTAMKVGTDGVLLGAWTNCSFANSILDIGTGTGLIALMMAQKQDKAKIIAIEIDKNAVIQAKQNIKESKWFSRIEVIQTSLQKFKPKYKFDLIVSNPPFFNNTYKSKSNSRNIARQTDTLSFQELLKHTSSLLSKNGKACFILPFSEKERFINIALKNKLFTNKILYIKGTIKTEVKRILLELSFKKTVVKKEYLTIEISRHLYTDEYIELVQDFYFKM